MIFSAKKWNNGKELKAVMKVNTAISFDMMEAPLRNAFRQYLVPLLGDAMVGEVVEIYEFGPNPDVLEQNTEGATEREKLDSRLLEITLDIYGKIQSYPDPCLLYTSPSPRD